MKDCDDNIIVGKNLFCCYDCAVEEACDNPNVAGYLTQTDNQKYKKDAQRCFQFMKDGYIVLNIHDWRTLSLYKLYGGALKHLLEGSPAGSKKKLPNGNERDVRRRWDELDIRAVK